MLRKIKGISLIFLLCTLSLLAGCNNNVSNSDLPLVKSEKEIMAEKLMGVLQLNDEEKAPILELSEKILNIKNNQKSNQQKELTSLTSELNTLLNKYTEEKLVPNEPNIDSIKKHMKSYKNSHDETKITTDNPVAQISELCVYNIIDGNKIEKSTKLEDSNIFTKEFEKKSTEAWENIKKVLPQEALKNLKHLQTFSTKNNRGTVSGGFFSKNDSGEYTLSINVYFDMNTLPYILFHEYGHYISLNSTQSDLESNGKYSQKYDEIRFKENSYMYKFFNEFYKYIYDDMETDKDGYLFYLRHKNEFVSIYAASHYYDDFAESFACFIINEQTENGKDKIKFFENFPELVKLKEEIAIMLKNNGLEPTKATT